MKYSIEELKNALQLVSSTITQCEKMKIKFKEGTSQSTLLKNRLKALYIAKYLIEEQINKSNPTKTWKIEELEFALIPLQSILNKSSKAFQHTKEGSSTFTRLNKIMNAMNLSITLINDKL